MTKQREFWIWKSESGYDNEISDYDSEWNKNGEHHGFIHVREVNPAKDLAIERCLNLLKDIGEFSDEYGLRANDALRNYYKAENEIK